MAGKTSQNTAAAPAGTNAPASPPASDVTTGGSSPAPSNNAPAPAPATRRQAPVSAPSQGTIHPDVDFDAEMRALEADLAGKGTQTEPKGGKTETSKPRAAQQPANTPDEDPLEQELEEAEAAAAKANLKVAEPEPEPEPEPVKPDNSNTTESEEETPDVGDPKYAEWLKSLSPKAAKKIERQQKQIASLKAAAANAIQIAPTADSPLAHVATPEQLEAENQHWSTVRDQIDRLREQLDMDPDTPLEITLSNGQKHRFNSLDEVKYSERYARATLNAVPDAKLRLNERASSKPWESASRLVPDLFERDSSSNKQAVDFLRSNPQFKLAFPDWEVKLAHMLRSMNMENEQKANKAKWVRLELDAEGNVKLPKKNTVARPAPAARVPSAPATARPALSANGRGDAAQAAIKKLEQTGSDDALRDAVKALMAA
jgi:hypothetical protein